MALTTNQRREVMARLAAALDREGPVGLTKAELFAAAGAVDDWIEANAAAMNAALPQPARGALNMPQKAVLFAFTALARAGGN